MPTKRTIFTVQNESTDSSHARATPTFVDIHEDEIRSSGDNLTSKQTDKKILKDVGEENMILHQEKTVNIAKDLRIEATCYLLNDKGQPCDRLNVSNQSNNEIENLQIDASGDTSQDFDNLNELSEETVIPINNSFINPYDQSSPSSPPVESKRRVLRAVNDDGDPTVKNMIQAYNQRITESQELLLSPFKEPRIVTAQKLLPQNKFFDKLSPSIKEHLQSGAVSKSQSASTIHSSTSSLLSESVSRSSSGPMLYRNFQHQQIPTVTSNSRSADKISLNKVQSQIPFNLNDTQSDIDSLMDETLTSFQETPNPTQPQSDNCPSIKLRAVRIKKAKEEFLARGAAPLSLENRLSGEFRLRSGTTSTEQSSRDSCDLSTIINSSPSPSPKLGNENEIDKQHRQPSMRKANIPKKQSFRRQSEGALLDDMSNIGTSPNVVKSASSGVIGFRKQRASTESPAEVQVPAVNLPVSSSKSAKNLFRFFKRSKDRKNDDATAIGKLCRQSLVVDLKNSQKESSQRSQPSSCLNKDEQNNEKYRASSTLPRERSNEVSSSSTRSCPSSPVASHRTKASLWLAKGKQIFKNRSPSPNKKQNS